MTTSARQFVETAQLLGVDFVPVANPHSHPHSPPLSPPHSHLSPPAGIADGADGAGARAEDASEPRPDPAAALAALRERYEREGRVPKLITGWTNIVFGVGDPDADLMFVGEAPGADEDAAGEPFVGRAGQKLNEMIRAMGLSREEVYIANVLKVRPPNNRTPSAEEAAADGPWLLEQINIIQPRVILTLGKPAAHFLLGRSDAMGDLRGRWFEHRGIPVMPTYHPAYLLRAYTAENRKKVWSDLQQALSRLGG